MAVFKVKVSLLLQTLGLGLEQTKQKSRVVSHCWSNCEPYTITSHDVATASYFFSYETHEEKKLLLVFLC